MATLALHSSDGAVGGQTFSSEAAAIWVPEDFSRTPTFAEGVGEWERTDWARGPVPSGAAVRGSAASGAGDTERAGIQHRGDDDYDAGRLEAAVGDDDAPALLPSRELSPLRTGAAGQQSRAARRRA